MNNSFEDTKGLLMQALQASNWNDVAIHATEMLKQEDNHAWLWANRGIALHRLGHPFDAILNYDRALALEDSAIAYCNKGAAYREMDKLDQAVNCYRKGLELDPTLAQLHMNLGHIYKWQRKDKLALESYRKCVEMDPAYVDGHLALAMILLKLGQLEEGWKEFEWRWRSEQLPPRGLKFPQWSGQDLSGKSILVYAEQGFGDILQFARYAQKLAFQFPTCKVIIESKQPTRRLMETLPDVYAVINLGDKVPLVDYAVPMITLAGMMTPTIADIPRSKLQYRINGDHIGAWGRRFEQLPEGVRVGVCWAGMSRTTNPTAAKIDEARSTTLQTLAALAKVKGITWISLQKGPPAEQVKTPPVGMTIADFTEDMYDFYETCCAIRNCDLVITVDTAVAHAAASVGVDTWMLSRWDNCWRWFGDRIDSPWYPTLKQFIQLKPDDWSGITDQMAEALAKRVREKSQYELNLTMAK